MDVAETNAAGAAGGLYNPVGGQELDKTAFLKLLVAQMKHQDPLEPMKNTEFVAQLAQFSGVEQLVSVNEGINMLQYQQMGMSNAQASTFVGKEVEVRSDKVQVQDGNGMVQLGFQLQDRADSITVNIRDAKGTVVRSIEMGAHDAGDIKLDWDTRDHSGSFVTPGTYRIDVVAQDAEGNPIVWESRVRGMVEGVNYSGGYPELVIGSIRADLADIVGVYSDDGVP